MTARRSIWSIVTSKDGLCDVERDRRHVRSGINRTKAIQIVRERFAEGDRVFEVDSDGTDRDITRKFR